MTQHLRNRITTTSLVAALLLAAPLAAAGGLTASLDALDPEAGCDRHSQRHDSSYQHENGAYSQSGYTAYESCAARTTLLRAGVANEGAPVAGAEATDGSSSSSSDAASQGQGWQSNPCPGPDGEERTCSFESWTTQSGSYRSTESGTRARAHGPTGTAEAGRAACTSTEASEDRSAGGWYSNGQESHSYRSDTHRSYRSSHCFTGASADQRLTGTGTGLDSASISATGGSERSSGTWCESQDGEGSCQEYGSEGGRGAATAHVPGLGTVSLDQRYQPTDPTLLP